jgi:hypothetical protein
MVPEASIRAAGAGRRWRTRHGFSELIRPLARRWNAELQIVAATGHALILDEHWSDCATAVLGWLARLEQRQAANSEQTKELAGVV